MIFITFYGKAKTEPAFKAGKLMTVPLMVLAVLSLIGGFVEMPDSFGNIHPFSDLIENTLPAIVLKAGASQELLFQLLSAIIALTGIYLAYLLYFKKSAFAESFSQTWIYKFFYKGWGFDKLYDSLFVKPIVWLAEIDKNDFIDWWSIGLSRLTLFVNRLISPTQNGKLRWYLMSFVIGIALILTYMIYK